MKKEPISSELEQLEDDKAKQHLSHREIIRGIGVGIAFVVALVMIGCDADSKEEEEVDGGNSEDMTMSDGDADADADADADSDSDSDSDADADADTDTDADADSDSNADADADADTDTDTDADADADSDADADADADTDSDADADTDTDSDADADTDTDSDSDADADTDTDTDSDADTDTDSDTDTGSEIDTDGDNIKLTVIETRGFTFDAREIGSDGEPVLLLHGFPETSLMWTGLMPVLSANGYHCLAPDQRGYSPGARPTEVDAYKYEELIEDAFAFGSELGDRFHVIGHDWGANVGWLMLATDPSRIASFTAISIPHYGVWAQSVYDDDEMAVYLRMLNTWMAEGTGEDFWTAQQMRNMWTAKPADQVEQTIEHMTEPGAMTAALNWYRASDGHKRVIEDFGLWEVSVPTLLIHGSNDMGERSVTDTKPLMTGSYRVVRPDGGHFIVDEQPEVVAEETLTHLRENPI